MEAILRDTEVLLQRTADPVAQWRLYLAIESLDSPDLLMEAIKELRKHLWERIHGIPWAYLPHTLRHAYGVVSYAEAYLLYHQSGAVCLEEVFAILDDGILMGADTSSSLIHGFIRDLEIQHHTQPIQDTYIFCERRVTLDNVVSSSLRLPSKKRPILYSSLVDTVTFYSTYLIPRIPVIFTDAVFDWPAIKAWSDLNYIRRVAGHRTVPIEIGKNYLHDTSGQKLLTISAFVKEYIAGISSDAHLSKKQRVEQSIAYLAQHRLLDQIPALGEDIIIPEYTAIVDDDDSGEGDVIINAWFGPVGTVSPLHNDCYHNLLAQVHGYKYVRLYEYEFTSHLYPRSGIYRNNSEVDMAEYSALKHPLLTAAPYQEFILHPGEMLFIPRWCWHYIAAVDRSFVEEFEASTRKRVLLPDDKGFCWSVSFWWGDRTLPPE